MIAAVIDAGHGGAQAGAAYDSPDVRFDGLQEKDFALSVTLFVELMMRVAGRNVRLTRQTDKFVSLKDRVKDVRCWQPACFVSIHADAYPDSPVEGFTVFHNEAGQELAQHINTSIGEFFPDERNRGVRPQRYYVLRKNPVPAVLVECGFISTLDQRLHLGAPDVQYRYALAITNGLNLFLHRNDKA